MSSADMLPLIEQFLSILEARGYAKETIGHRRHSLMRFHQWCDERGLSNVVDVTRVMLERYQRWLFQYRRDNGDPLTIQAQHNYLSAVRLFFRWLVKENRVLHNPAADIEMPKVPRRLPRSVLSVEQVEKLLQTPNVALPHGLRDRAILEVLYSTGMRRTELVQLMVDDVDFHRGTVMIRLGKGRKDRVVPIGARALAWLRKYLDEVRPDFARPAGGNTAFLTDTGAALTPGMLTNLVRRYVELSEVGKVGACHMLRHTAATLMLEGGADIRFIQQLLGHALLTTTQVYTRVSIAKLKEVHDATHPGATLSLPKKTA